MYTINFKVKRWIHPNTPVIGMFIESWADETTAEYEWGYTTWNGSQPASMSIECKNSEDAVALKLRGLPTELLPYFQMQ